MSNIKNPSNTGGRTKVESEIDGASHENTNPNTEMQSQKILENTSSTSTYKINSIVACNKNNVNSSLISVGIKNANGVMSYLVKKMSIPVGFTHIISTRETYFYLEEDYAICAAQTSSGDDGGNQNNNAISLLISYEEIVTS